MYVFGIWEDSSQQAGLRANQCLCAATVQNTKKPHYKQKNIEYNLVSYSFDLYVRMGSYRFWKLFINSINSFCTHDFYQFKAECKLNLSTSFIKGFLSNHTLLCKTNLCFSATPKHMIQMQGKSDLSFFIHPLCFLIFYWRTKSYCGSEDCCSIVFKLTTTDQCMTQ